MAYGLSDQDGGCERERDSLKDALRIAGNSLREQEVEIESLEQALRTAERERDVLKQEQKTLLKAIEDMALRLPLTNERPAFAGDWLVYLETKVSLLGKEYLELRERAEYLSGRMADVYAE